MKKNLLLIVTCFAFNSISFIYAQNPVPNPGFENWTAGNPDNWLTNNIVGFAVPVTQTTPPYSGTYAAKGEVVSTAGGPYTPFLYSNNMSGNGFPVSQAYATLSFYYKFNQVGSAVFEAAAVMYDAVGAPMAVTGQAFAAPVTSYTLASLPFFYSGTNPDTCIIYFTISDTTGTTAVGSYFVVDEVSLSGTVGITETQAPVLSIQKVNPNPVNSSAFIYYSLPGNSDVTFELMDVTGRKYHEMLVPGEIAGQHKIEFKASAIPPGFYFLTMKAASGIAAVPVMVIH